MKISKKSFNLSGNKESEIYQKALELSWDKLSVQVRNQANGDIIGFSDQVVPQVLFVQILRIIKGYKNELRTKKISKKRYNE